MKEKGLSCFWWSFCSLFDAWKIVGMNKEEKKVQREGESREMVGERPGLCNKRVFAMPLSR